MSRIFSILSIFIITLYARENPFFPAKGELELPFSSNIHEKYEPLKQATMQLPSTARVVESFSVTYKKLDGSVATQTVTLNNNIDWHIPLFLSQSYHQDNVQNQNHSKKKSVKNDNYEEIFRLAFSTFYVNNNSIKIKTKDKLLRNFIVNDPHRIVCDFQRDIDIRSITKKISGEWKVRNIRVGNHKGYYRVVIELDGLYKYNFKKDVDGYVFELI